MPTLIAISISSPPISLISIAGPGLALCGCVSIQSSSLGDGQTTTETELAGRQTAVLRPHQPLIGGNLSKETDMVYVAVNIIIVTTSFVNKKEQWRVEDRGGLNVSSRITRTTIPS